ncbi:hypothetical protein V6N11_072911 [Hibiscus sabdariffa]|uniref:Uncharacterized protein n=1 Tax=Hibiscus sabdariffa TaxID=183260 RepID=A0ABR2P0I6_9ROSI
MSTGRGSPFRRRVQPVRFAEPLDEIPVDIPAPVNPSPSVESSTPVDPPGFVDPPVPNDLPHVPDSDATTPARGASTSSSEPMIGVVDEPLSRQFFHLIQSVVRVASTIPETPISHIQIFNGVRTFSGPSGGAPTEAEEWLHDTERLIRFPARSDQPRQVKDYTSSSSYKKLY